MALGRYEDGLCQCGFHESLTADRANGFVPGHRVCPVCAGGDQYDRMLAEADEKAGKVRGDSAPPQTPRPSDGRYRFVRMLTPGEFEERRAAKPGKPPEVTPAPSRKSPARSKRPVAARDQRAAGAPRKLAAK